MYCARLYERMCAKELVHDYQLMDKYFSVYEKPKRRLTQEEKYVDNVNLIYSNNYYNFFFVYRNTNGIENQIKKFSRYLTEVESWSLIIRLQQEYLLKKRREELIYYRKNGITKMHDIVKFNLLHYSMVVDGMYNIFIRIKFKFKL